MQLTLHVTRRTPHGASRLVQTISTWSVKTRRAPSRHCREARVYGHTTTAIHDIEYPPPPRPRPAFRARYLHKGDRYRGGLSENVSFDILAPSLLRSVIELDKSVPGGGGGAFTRIITDRTPDKSPSRTMFMLSADSSLNPFNTAVPIWVQTTLIPSALSPI